MPIVINKRTTWNDCFRDKLFAETINVSDYSLLLSDKKKNY